MKRRAARSVVFEMSFGGRAARLKCWQTTRYKVSSVLNTVSSQVKYNFPQLLESNAKRHLLFWKQMYLPEVLRYLYRWRDEIEVFSH